MFYFYLGVGLKGGRGGGGGGGGTGKLVEAIAKVMQTSGTGCFCIDSRKLMQAGRHIWSMASSRLQQEWAPSASSNPTPAGHCHHSPGTQPLLGGGIVPFHLLEKCMVAQSLG